MIFKYFIIGLIQGFTEFLPISSSGHIVLFSEIFNINCDIVLLSVVAHLGTLLSVLICMRKKIFDIVKRPFSPTTLNLIIATLPAVIVVILFNDLIDKIYGLQFLIYGFLITGILLSVADLIKPKYDYIGKKSSLLMGLMQGVAVLPGISRSGSTMAVGMMAGVKKQEACEFSFLMSIPIILGSAVWEFLGIVNTNVSFNLLPLFVALITSFIFGMLSIKLMLKIVKSNKLYVFSIYTVIISIITFVIIIN